jgi:hypothetical protein
MKYQVCNQHGGLAFYEGETPEEALAIFMRDTLHALTKLDLIEQGGGGRKAPRDFVLHPENGKPAELRISGSNYYAVPVKS